MSREILPPSHPGLLGAAIVGDDAAILDRIAELHAHFALWRRARPMELDWIDGLDWHAIDDIRLKVEAEGHTEAIAAALEEAGYPGGEKRGALCDEIASLTAHFTRITACHRLRIRLEVIETNACRKFHADMVTARMLTTLSGPGTQWIEANSPEGVQELRAGDVAVFKGRLWIDRSAILHRSPPIEGSGATRLLLVIDPVHDNDAPPAGPRTEQPLEDDA